VELAKAKVSGSGATSSELAAYPAVVVNRPGVNAFDQLERGDDRGQEIAEQAVRNGDLNHPQLHRCGSRVSKRNRRAC